MRTGLYIVTNWLSWPYFLARTRSDSFPRNLIFRKFITTVNTIRWSQSMKKVTVNRRTWYTAELNTFQRLWPYGECSLCCVLLPIEYCYHHTFLQGKSTRHKTHSTVLRTPRYNKKYQRTLCCSPWSILIDIQHQSYVPILACSDCYQCSTVVPRPRNEPLQEPAALHLLEGVITYYKYTKPLFYAQVVFLKKWA
jgi:hypothetical protein